MSTFASLVRKMLSHMNVPCNKKDRLSLLFDIRPLVDDTLYQELHPYIESAKALARLTYKSLYIIDYNKMNFLYVSGNPLFLCGESVDEVLGEGYQFYYRHVPEEDQAFLQQVNQAFSDFLREIAISERSEYTISYNFRIILSGFKEPVLINHQLTPLRLDSQGNIWLSLCLVSLAHSREVGDVYIQAVNSNMQWRLSAKSGRWKQIEPLTLSNQEKNVIRLAHQGLSVREIADRIHRSEDSVKGYRKALFQKLNVSNISEAIAVATSRKLI